LYVRETLGFKGKLVRKGGQGMKELEIDATGDNLSEVIAFIDGQLEGMDCSMNMQLNIELAVEEIFVNIASYAYESEVGKAVIQSSILENPLAIEITFIDSGMPYNPLARKDPDISLPLHKRKKGGLGVFMVKQTMDDVSYEYKDGKNIFTIRKLLDE
jgi:anti-sigma regulatory factor (Ser/Thr protein kinase)